MTTEHTDDTATRIAGILDEIGQLAIARGWRREDVAVAMARGAGELALHGSSTSAELDRAIGALQATVTEAGAGRFGQALDS